MVLILRGKLLANILVEISCYVFVLYDNIDIY